MYLRSGISIVSAIKIISSHYKSNKKIELFLTTISAYLDEGKDFYTALQMQEVVTLPEFK
jgi:type II secretory pathway component PulF